MLRVDSVLYLEGVENGKEVDLNREIPGKMCNIAGNENLEPAI